MTKVYSVRYAATLVWMGAVGAISFMEAPLKFQAPSISLKTGLEVGQIVFGMLNRMEWVLCLLMLASLLLAGANKKGWLMSALLGVILAIQSVVLLPALHHRAELIIQGENPPSSPFHFYYIGLEVLKMILLGAFSWYTIYGQTDIKYEK